MVLILWILGIILTFIITILILTALMTPDILKYFYFILKYGLIYADIYYNDSPITKYHVDKYIIKRDAKINFYLAETNENIEGKVIGFDKAGMMSLIKSDGSVWIYHVSLINRTNLLYLRI